MVEYDFQEAEEKGLQVLESHRSQGHKRRCAECKGKMREAVRLFCNVKILEFLKESGLKNKVS